MKALVVEMYDGTCLPHGGQGAREEKEAGEQVLRFSSRVCFPKTSLPPNGEALLRELYVEIKL